MPNNAPIAVISTTPEGQLDVLFHQRGLRTMPWVPGVCVTPVPLPHGFWREWQRRQIWIIGGLAGVCTLVGQKDGHRKRIDRINIKRPPSQVAINKCISLLELSAFNPVISSLQRAGWGMWVQLPDFEIAPLSCILQSHPQESTESTSQYRSSWWGNKHTLVHLNQNLSDGANDSFYILLNRNYKQPTLL